MFASKDRKTRNYKLSYDFQLYFRLYLVSYEVRKFPKVGRNPNIYVYKAI